VLVEDGLWREEAAARRPVPSFRVPEQPRRRGLSSRRRAEGPPGSRLLLHLEATAGNSPSEGKGSVAAVQGRSMPEASGFFNVYLHCYCVGTIP
jgi:hypothetical protein